MSIKSITTGIATLALFASLTPGLMADDQDKKAQGAETTMTGCLMKGAADGEFVMADEATGKKYEVSGSELAQHVNHKIRVTGKVANEAGTSVDVNEVEMISTDCKVPGSE